MRQNCWIVTHALLAIITLHFQWFSASVLYDEWLGLFSVANVFGFGLTFFAYFKSWLAPSHAKDCKWSGSWVYDMVSGRDTSVRIHSHSSANCEESRDASDCILLIELELTQSPAFALLASTLSLVQFLF